MTCLLWIWCKRWWVVPPQCKRMTLASGKRGARALRSNYEFTWHRSSGGVAWRGIIWSGIAWQCDSVAWCCSVKVNEAAQKRQKVGCRYYCCQCYEHEMRMYKHNAYSERHVSLPARVLVCVCPTMLYVTKVITFLRRILRAHALSRNNTSSAPICFMHFPNYILYICIAIEQAPQLMICLQSEVRFVSAWQPQRLNSKHWFHFFYFIHTNITSYLNSLFEFIFTFHQLWFARLRCAHHLYFYFPPCSILFRKGYLEG